MGPQFKVSSLCIFLFGSLLLTGCQAYNALTFSPAEKSGKKNQKIGIEYFLEGKFVDYTKGEDIPEFEKLGQGNEENFPKGLGQQLRNCKVNFLPPPPKRAEEFPVPIIPIIAALGQYVLELGTDALADSVEELKNRSQATYGAKKTVEASILRGTSTECFLMFRSAEEIEEPEKNHFGLGMVLLLRSQKLGAGVSLVPTYLWYANSVAETDKAEAEKRPKINVNIAISFQYLDKNPNDVLLVKQIAPTPFEINGVELDESQPLINCKLSRDNSDNSNLEDCTLRSSILAASHTAEGGATISIAVVETGSHASKFDKAKGQLKALKEAIGPAVKETLTKQLTPDD